MSRIWLGIFILVMIGRVSVCQELEETLSVDFKDLPLEIVLDSITYKTGYFFSYNADAIPDGSLYTIKRTFIQLDSLINLLLVGTKLEHLKKDKQVIIRKKPEDFSYKVLGDETKKSIVRGWVRLKDDNSPIIGVNVFFNGTTIGSVTDENGNFVVRDVPPGTHQLIVAHVGYETNAYQIKVYNGNTYVVNSLLEYKIQELPSIEVISLPLADSSNWPKYYQEFEREFIGHSSNSFHCKILNPSVVSFTYDEEKDILRAYVDEPLIVFNKALGYELTCAVEYFEKSKGETRFHLRARFKNLEYKSDRQRRRWKKNRKVTYEGSSTHFFQSLIRDKHRREGFRVYLVKNDESVREVDRGDLLVRNENGFSWTLSFDGYLTIQYLNETESPEYIAYLDRLEEARLALEGAIFARNRLPGAQVSRLELLENEVVLFSNGQVQKPEDILRLGYWSWERLADLMPINYDPKHDDL